MPQPPVAVRESPSVTRPITTFLGLTRSTPFQLGHTTLDLRTHSIWGPAHDIQRRPFDIITESLVRNFSDKERYSTAHEPNSDIISTTPMFPRWKPKLRPYPDKHR
ncbi:hypothetical protein NEOLEDRAFT_1074269 [Neolentinus lepideus HHB14362 ss-1]|uniref:Uncharacterized protein n=1 Tax=Neolentinus lepideus HHB14362 ss-1 TaxID=1314782 RepID=A0A165PJ84_9AGAM|nr:hypothetical protein NEOLEDRAFT_1074269 [Neolentinus lepideus HHB14362 ss-1]